VVSSTEQKSATVETEKHPLNYDQMRILADGAVRNFFKNKGTLTDKEAEQQDNFVKKLQTPNPIAYPDLGLDLESLSDESLKFLLVNFPDGGRTNKRFLVEEKDRRVQTGEMEELNLDDLIVEKIPEDFLEEITYKIR